MKFLDYVDPKCVKKMYRVERANHTINEFPWDCYIVDDNNETFMISQIIYEKINHIKEVEIGL